MKLPSVDQMCNIGGCVLIFVLLALLVLKPNGIMSILEGQSPLGNGNNNNNVGNKNSMNNNNGNNNAMNNNNAKNSMNNNNGNKNAMNNNNAKNNNNSKNRNNNNAGNMNKNAVGSSVGIGQNEQFASVSGIQTPSRSCYPQDSLSPKDLLPTDDAKNIGDFNKDYPISEGVLKGVNFLEAGYQVGVNTVGQSLRNANRQIRSEPPNPQVSVSPWMNTTIAPDLDRQPVEVGEDCYASIGNNSL